MQFKDTVFTRRSNRFLKDNKIDDESIKYILECGERAPVALGKYEQLKFYVVEGTTLSKLKNIFITNLGQDNTYNCGLLIILTSTSLRNDLKNQDAGCVGTTLCLAANDINLGSVYLHSVVPFLNENKDIKTNLLKIKDEEEVMCAIAIGEKEKNDVRDLHHFIDKEFLK